MKNSHIVISMVKGALYACALAFLSSCGSNSNRLVLADNVQLTKIKNTDSYKSTVAWQVLSEYLKNDLIMEPLSVTMSAPLIPNGNPNDYYSVGPYWWPNPSSADGLPWLKRDGERNYQFRGEYSDNKMFFRLASAISRLALAYQYTNDSKYAIKLEELVKHWFLNKETAMTPHLEFGQGVPGIANGRPYGIIEFRHLLMILDGVTISKPVTSHEFNQGFERWASKFLQWLTTSNIGTEQETKHNNHGTYYDALVGGLHLFLGNKTQAIEVFNRTKKRIVQQINAIGQQPHELERTRPYHYSAFNLLAFTQLAQMAEQVDIDLWRYPNQSDPRILNAFNYLLDNANEAELWQGKSESKVNLRHMVVPALRINRFQPVNLNVLLEHESSHAEFIMCQLLFFTKQTTTRIDSNTLNSNSLACTL